MQHSRGARLSLLCGGCLLAFACVACTPPPEDGPDHDGNATDGGVGDAGDVDAGAPPGDDAGPLDAGQPDAGAADAGAADAGAAEMDAGTQAPLSVTLSDTDLVIVVQGRARVVTATAAGGTPPFNIVWSSAGADAAVDVGVDVGVDVAGDVGVGATLDVGTLAAGDMTLTATVSDADGNVATSSGVTVHVLPVRFDWSHKLRPDAAPAAGDWLSPVKDQQMCGSCWAYAAVAVMEARYNIQEQDPDIDIDLSEQDIIDCWVGAGGCIGGAPEQALDGYARVTGVPTESCRPSLGRDDVCSATCADSSAPARWSISSFAFHVVDSREQRQEWIRDQLVHHGPIARAFEGMYDWNPSTFVCDGGQGSHFVVVVGYDDADGRWLLRNSWGAAWNGNGYFEVQYGTCAVDAGASAIGDVIAPGG